LRTSSGSLAIFAAILAPHCGERSVVLPRLNSAVSGVKDVSWQRS
jgi:hypothetical protein